jgi:hypothetical protein
MHQRPVHSRQSVMGRTGAIPSPEMVYVCEDAISKKNVFPSPPNGPRQGSDWQTFLAVKAWVKNVAYTKKVWVDVHVFDSRDELIHADTLTLRYVGPADGFPGDGDFFAFDGKIYQGSTATPGAVSPKPEARTVQYRIYYEVNHQLFTDAVLHQHELPADAVSS